MAVSTVPRDLELEEHRRALTGFCYRARATMASVRSETLDSTLDASHAALLERYVDA
jgi:hypothetical protein